MESKGEAKRRTWQVLDAIVSAAGREAIEYGFMEAGAIGTESSTDPCEVIWVRGYFEPSGNPEQVRATLLEALRIYELPATSLIELKSSELVECDWLEDWKKDWQPIAVGRFIVGPPWALSTPASTSGIASGPSSDPIIIRINPGMAFGTGTHETTRLCLKAIEKYFRGGSFLDVGTGTGILAIAAAKMFPAARVEAYDTDAEAIAIARENAELNGVIQQIDFQAGSITEETASADLVCANLTAPAIVELLPRLLGVSCGRLVLSGILNSQIELVQSQLFQQGVPIIEMDADGEWVAIVV